jgi:predicted dehydrogenase
MGAPATPPTIGVGIIGFGVMGATHARAYQSAAAAGFPCQLLAICDSNPQPAPTGNLAAQASTFDTTGLRRYTDAAALLADPAIHLVSICTPTDSHVELALAALAAGKNVLLEKPVAIEPAQVRRLADAARNAPTLCMPAMCMRFWPGWASLRELIREGEFGRLDSIRLTRLGAPPGWSQDFYADTSRSGGALVDLHIHDADFLVWCFGRPRGVRSTGSGDHVTTHYDFGGPAATAEGGWILKPTDGFRMLYRAVFERATVEFDLSRSPSVSVETEHAVVNTPLPEGTGYDWEVRHLLTTIATGSRDLTATLDEAVTVAEVLAAERESIRTGKAVHF